MSGGVEHSHGKVNVLLQVCPHTLLASFCNPERFTVQLIILVLEYPGMGWHAFGIRPLATHFRRLVFEYQESQLNCG